MVFGDVRNIVIEQSVMRDGRVAPDLLDPIGRLGGSWYTRAAADLFEMKRPTWEGLMAREDAVSPRPPSPFGAGSVTDPGSRLERPPIDLELSSIPLSSPLAVSRQ